MTKSNGENKDTREVQAEKNTEMLKRVMAGGNGTEPIKSRPASEKFRENYDKIKWRDNVR